MMKWHSGSISEAIADAKANSGLFIVVVHNPTTDFEDSASFLSMFDCADLTSAICDSARHVAVRIENASDTCKQFAQIYPVVIVPSVYFIDSRTGVDLEVTGGPDLSQEKILACLEKAEKTLGKAEKKTTDSAQRQTPNPSDVMSPRGARVEAAMQVLRDSTVSEAPKPESSQQEKTTLEERVAKAKRLLAERQAKKMAEEGEKEKAGEVERRELGRQMQELKRRQDEEAMMAAAAERRKDKEEQKLAKEKIKRQIELDRAERAEKFNKDKEEQRKTREEQERAKLAAQAKQAEEETIQRCSMARIQFRLPDGRSQTKQFTPESPLSELYTFVLGDEVSLGFSNISLSTAFPNRQLDQEPTTSTLRSLGLVPSATVLVLPKSSSVLARGGSDGGIWSFVMLLLTPLTALWAVISGFIFPTSGATPSAASNSNAASVRNHWSSQNKNQGGYRREGNVARLRNQSDDDDESNTYNGNSTQQM